MAALVHLVIRWLHVLGMAVLLGGAVFAWVALQRIGKTRSGTGQGRERSVLAIAAGYEWLFWGAIGVVVMAGVGNLGALAPSIPSNDSAWGFTLSIKLLAVLGLLLGSVARTVLVGSYQSMDTITDTQIRTLRRVYSATAVYLIGILGLAEVLAHG